jgi:hypothetical protein
MAGPLFDFILLYFLSFFSWPNCTIPICQEVCVRFHQRSKGCDPNISILQFDHATICRDRRHIEIQLHTKLPAVNYVSAHTTQVTTLKENDEKRT